jgi:hypothetical protein
MIIREINAKISDYSKKQKIHDFNLIPKNGGFVVFNDEYVVFLRIKEKNNLIKVPVLIKIKPDPLQG